MYIRGIHLSPFSQTELIFYVDQTKLDRPAGHQFATCDKGHMGASYMVLLRIT